ncbi:MAG: MYXO-CTERM sorting domain-containing protein, partial [Sandaracinaceae bacterium]|nr:MYXO-CTERM sorting domain-containing protein [Sandaracinaceae bacterium]
EGGCGCTVPGPSDGPPASLALLAVVGFALRRRRTR